MGNLCKSQTVDLGIWECPYCHAEIFFGLPQKYDFGWSGCPKCGRKMTDSEIEAAVKHSETIKI